LREWKEGSFNLISPGRRDVGWRENEKYTIFMIAKQIISTRRG